MHRITDSVLRVPALMLFLTIVCLSYGQVVSIDGHAYDTSTCKGVGHLIVKVLPPNSSQFKSIVVTNTDEAGDFQLQVPIGKYYIQVSEGVTNQVYGQVVDLTNQRRLLIPLRRSNTQAVDRQCPGVTESGSSDSGVMPERFTILHGKKRLLTSQAFQKRVCVRIGHIYVPVVGDADFQTVRFRPFHLYTLVANNALSDCRHGDWERRTIAHEGQIEEFTYPTLRFSIRVLKVDYARREVELEVGKPR